MGVAILFARSWSLCAVIDMLATLYLWVGHDLRALVLGVMVLLRAVAVLKRPTAGRLAALAAVWAIHILSHFPFVPNHNVALAGVNLTIAIATGALMLRRRSFRVPLDEAHERFAGIARLHLVALYALAALHKLNWDYLDPQRSCASALARGIAGKLGLPHAGFADVLAIAGSLGLEIAIPLLLASRRTRLVGLAVGLPFHLVLSLDSVVPILGFSAAIYSLYTLFLPEAMAADIVRRRLPGAAVGALVAAGVALAVLAGGRGDDAAHLFLLPPPPVALPAAVVVGGGLALRTAWHLLAGAALVAFAGALARRRPAPWTASRRPALALLVLPALVIADGVSPYLGLKTVPCFSMFSNLRTEEGATNHLFLPSLRGPSLEDDLVDIVDSSSARLQAVAGARIRVPYFELRRLLSGEDREASAFLIGGTDEVARPDFWVVFRRDGRAVRVSRADTPDHDVFRSHAWWTSKLVAYRLLPARDQPATCVW